LIGVLFFLTAPKLPPLYFGNPAYNFGKGLNKVIAFQKQLHWSDNSISAGFPFPMISFPETGNSNVAEGYEDAGIE
jgi:hypothetical protein